MYVKICKIATLYDPNLIKKIIIQIESKTAEILTAVLTLWVSQVQLGAVLRTCLTQKPYKFNK